MQISTNFSKFHARCLFRNVYLSIRSIIMWIHGISSYKTTDRQDGFQVWFSRALYRTVVLYYWTSSSISSQNSSVYIIIGSTGDSRILSSRIKQFSTAIFSTFTVELIGLELFLKIWSYSGTLIQWKIRYNAYVMHHTEHTSLFYFK